MLWMLGQSGQLRSRSPEHVSNLAGLLLRKVTPYLRVVAERPRRSQGGVIETSGQAEARLRFELILGKCHHW
eukprot:2130948-Amphidinium_carterae.1